MDLLNSEPVVSLSGDEFLPIEGKTFIQQVQEFFAAQGGKANSPFGTVLLDKKGIKNDLGHGIGRLKAASFAAVKDVLEKGVVINPMGQYHTNNKKNPTGMIAAPITIGDEKYVCVVEVIANRQVTRLYVHEVTLTKTLQGDVADSNAVPGDTNLVTQPQGEIAKVLRNYVNTKNNDENNSKTENRHMNKKQIRLTESDLKQIVKESVGKILSEAYGTPDAKTQKDVDYIRRNNSDYGQLTMILKNLFDSVVDFRKKSRHCMGEEVKLQKAAVKACDNFIDKMQYIMKLYGNKQIQYQGEQPDEDYYYKHQLKDKRGGYGSSEMFEL